MPVRCAGGRLVPGGETALSIRQHDIRLLTAPPADAGENVLPATVVRNVFLGGTRDYMVELADRTQLRVVTAPETSVPQGTQVWLHVPPERCRALTG